MWTDTLDRAKLVELAYQRGKELNLRNKNYLNWLKKFFDEEYQEDIGSGDITSEATLPKNKLGRSVLKAKQSGIVGGVEEVSWFYKKHGLKVEIHAEDAQQIQRGNAILKVYGNRKDILATERIGLNVLQRMSGIATETKHLVDLLKGYETRIAATRKAHWRYLDKKAVFLGGGLTHRFGLWDSILIKDNHLEALKCDGIKNPVEKAITLASQFIDKVGFIEIETTNQDDAIRAARKFKQLKLKKPCIIMLDNVTPKEIEQIMETLKSENLYDYMLLEASGNITTGNITEYAKTGVDVVSLGCLTHSAKIFDMSLEITL
jgi:nicotinate-nucleotide pyrophosphorylase (carboxylating)